MNARNPASLTLRVKKLQQLLNILDQVGRLFQENEIHQFSSTISGDFNVMDSEMRQLKMHACINVSFTVFQCDNVDGARVNRRPHRTSDRDQIDRAVEFKKTKSNSVVLSSGREDEQFPEDFLDSSSQAAPSLGRVDGDGVGGLVADQMYQGRDQRYQLQYYTDVALAHNDVAANYGHQVSSRSSTLNIANLSRKRSISSNRANVDAKTMRLNANQTHEQPQLVTNTSATVTFSQSVPETEPIVGQPHRRVAKPNIANPVFLPPTTIQPVMPSQQQDNCDIFIQLPADSRQESIIRCGVDLVISQEKFCKLIPMELRASLSNDLSLHPLYPPPSLDAYLFLEDVSPSTEVHSPALMPSSLRPR